jgi:hypothetical protein
MDSVSLQQRQRKTPASLAKTGIKSKQSAGERQFTLPRRLLFSLFFSLAECKKQTAHR